VIGHDVAGAFPFALCLALFRTSHPPDCGRAEPARTDDSAGHRVALSVRGAKAPIQSRLPPARGVRRRGHSGDLARHELAAGPWLQTVDEVRLALRVAGRGEDRAVVCLEDVQ
jgi:hypothetical protein